MVWVPVISATVPSGAKRMSTFSCGEPPVPLMWQAKPRPRSRPRAALSARRAGKPATSARASARSKRRREIAAVDGEAERVGHRHRRRRHEVAPAQFRPVEPALARRGIDQPLHDRIAASAKPGPRGTPIGVVLVNTAVISQRDGRDGVDRAGQLRVLLGLHTAGAARHVGAEIGQAVDPQRQELSLARPSASAASAWWSRAWWSARKVSLRLAIHFTGRPTRLAAHSDQRVLGDR